MTKLLQAEVEIIPIDTCNGSGSYGGTLFPGVLCAGRMNGEQEACVVRKNR